jgi:hypothetical protein
MNTMKYDSRRFKKGKTTSHKNLINNYHKLGNLPNKNQIWARGLERIVVKTNSNNNNNIDILFTYKISKEDYTYVINTMD